MGRPIRQVGIGTREHLSKIDDILSRIDGAEVYWGDNGTLAVVAPPEWRAYLTGKSNVHPRDIHEDGIVLPQSDVQAVSAVLFEEMGG